MGVEAKGVIPGMFSCQSPSRLDWQHSSLFRLGRLCTFHWRFVSFVGYRSLQQSLPGCFDDLRLFKLFLAVRNSSRHAADNLVDLPT